MEKKRELRECKRDSSKIQRKTQYKNEKIRKVGLSK